MTKDSNPQFDELLLSKSRLGILCALLSGDRLEFTYLRNALELSDGNLSVQLTKLEQAGYIKTEKMFIDKKPKTFCRITAKGRASVQNLLCQLGDLVRVR